MAEPASVGASSSQSGAHPAQANPVSHPAPAPPEGASAPGVIDRTNPRSRGFSPARDAREQRQAQQQPGRPNEQQSAPGDQGQGQPQAGAEQTFDIDGTQWTSQQVRDAIAHKIEQDAKHAARPQSPDQFQVKLPADFKPPGDVKFEFDQNDPLLKTSRELAHKRGLSQEEYSDFLGVYAASKIAEAQRLAPAREAQRAALGSAVDSRIEAVGTWLRARCGNKADGLIAQLKTYPVAAYVEAFEEIQRQFSGQGSTYAPSGGHTSPDTSGKIPGYESMSFEQKRAAQENYNAPRRGR